MVTTYTVVGGVSPDRSGRVYLPSDAELAFFALGDAYADQKKAIWIDPAMAIGALADGPPALFSLQDRFGDRLFVPEPDMNRHPIVLADALTGKPAMHFGLAGGVAPNDWSAGHNGGLIPSLGADALGQGQSSAPLYAPGGWSAAIKFRVGPTINGFAFANPGGTLLGNAVTNPATSSLVIGIETTYGHIWAFNQWNVQNKPQYLEVYPDHRDSLWHSLLVQYDAAAGRYSAWVDPVDATTDVTLAQSGCTTDINVAAGGSLPMIGGFNTGPVSPNGLFQGAISHLSWFPVPLWSVAANRQAAINLLAER